MGLSRFSGAVLLNLELRYTGKSFPAQSAGQGDVTWLRFNTIEQMCVVAHSPKFLAAHSHV